MTEYVVLVASGESETVWEQYAVVTARSTQAAIRDAAEGRAGRYVAVPARSWQPVTVKVETQTRMVLT